jgi:hypothetical protein
MPELLRLVALDSQDLAVISANLQDALVKITDMAYLPSMKRFVIVAARFDWLRAASQGAMERCRAGLHFERVLKVSRLGFDQQDSSLILNLLSIGFNETDAPGGHVILTFSGGGAVRLDVECLEAQMRDIGPRWKAKGQPGHQLDDVG